MLFDVVEHLGPIVPLINGFVGEGSPPDMIFIVTIVNLLHYPPDLLGSEAYQVWVIV